jgi:predicted ABC-type ATPase
VAEGTKEIIIVAGPNGSGKTSFANAFLPMERQMFVYINADEIARGLDQPSLSEVQLIIRAGREMLERISATISAGYDLMFETTLATLTYAQKIPRWRAQGYRVALIYLRLPDVEASISRVKKRVAGGGHAIPDDVIRVRFSKSLEYLELHYKPLVDEWYLWDSLEGRFELREARSQNV